MEQRRKLTIQLEGTQLDLIEGDITQLDVEAVVNSATEDLTLGNDDENSVGTAIKERGGPAIQEECERIGHAPTGTAVLTTAGNLPAQHVIHAVGPRLGEGEEERKLQSAVRASLALADRHNLKSIAIPAISTGELGFPMDRCAKILLTEVYRYLQGGTKIERVVISLFGDEAFEIFKRELRRGFR